MEVTIVAKKRRKTVQKIPDYLIYEIIGGKTYYYRGYKDVLNGTKTFEEILMDSTLQAWLKLRLGMLLGNILLPKGYEITVGEQGLMTQSGDRYGADIAIFSPDDIVLDAHYSKNPPEVIIEIDTKANLDNTTVLDYIVDKIKGYHNFGVKNVIWIFTKNKKIMVAQANESWLTSEWSTDVVVLGDVVINLTQIIGNRFV